MNDKMLRQVFLSKHSWYCRDYDRLETSDPNAGFFSVTTKSSNKTNLDLELGDFDNRTEENEFDRDGL